MHNMTHLSQVYFFFIHVSLAFLSKTLGQYSCTKSFFHSVLAVLCAGCEEYHVLHEGQCVPDCPESFFEDNELRECLRCHPDCALCDGPNNNDCDVCVDPEATLHNGACLPACPSHTYRDAITGECQGTVENINRYLRGNLRALLIHLICQCYFLLQIQSFLLGMTQVRDALFLRKTFFSPH